MLPLSDLLHARRPFCLCAGALALLLGIAAPASLRAQSSRGHLPEPRPSVSDSTSVPDWARRLVRVRRLVGEAETAPAWEAAERAAQAFAEARVLIEDPGLRRDLEVRALVIEAQALYETHFGPVSSTALSPEELAALRGEALAGLAHEDPTMRFEVVLPEVVEEPVVPMMAALQYPAHAEPLIAQQARWVSRTFGSAGSLRRRARPYFPLIERALAQRGVPPEMKYLAVIESGLNPGAVSAAGAIGLWQILPTTGAMYGVSEGALYHPQQSSRTAARYLAYLGELFGGDWQLVLAAYNCGPGRVQGLVRQARRRLGRTPTYWDIYAQLPAETRAYVPRFIAVARAYGEA